MKRNRVLHNNKPLFILYLSGLVRNKRNSSVTEDFLKYTVRWMANCVQLILFLRKHNFKLPFVAKKSTEDDPHSAFRNLATGLEEMVVFCFQQAIYAITKVCFIFSLNTNCCFGLVILRWQSILLEPYNF